MRLFQPFLVLSVIGLCFFFIVNTHESVASAQNGTPAPAGTPARAPRPNQIVGQPGEAPSPNQPVTPSTQTTTTSPAGSTRNERFFALQSPQMEGRFNETSRRLAGMEQRLAKSNQELVKRLGDARDLPAERQNKAVLDILQQVLQDQAQLQQYLVQARSAWTGDLEPGSDTGTAGEPIGTNPAEKRVPPTNSPAQTNPVPTMQPDYTNPHPKTEPQR